MSLQQRDPEKALRLKCGCGIRAFASKEAAERQLARVTQRALRDVMPNRVVECWRGQWHVVGSRHFDTGPDKGTRLLVKDRDLGACACCGNEITSGWYSLQHRFARGGGGTSNPAINTPANLILLCGSATSPGGCHLACEARTPLLNEMGFWLKSGQDPAATPVAHASHGWVLLDTEGGYTPVPRGAA